MPRIIDYMTSDKDQKVVRRDTMQKRIVLEAVRMNKNHPTADEVYSEIHKIHPKISKATVYRNLKLLAEQGEILRIEMPDADRFDFNLDKHYHLLCIRCGKVFDSIISYNENIDKTLSENTDFVVFGHKTIFECICSECLKKDK